LIHNIVPHIAIIHQKKSFRELIIYTNFLILFHLAVPGREVHHPERHRHPALQVLAAHPAGALRTGGGSSLLSFLDPEWIRFRLGPWSRIQAAKVVCKIRDILVRIRSRLFSPLILRMQRKNIFQIYEKRKEKDPEPDPHL
jgi:hypothetical protein